MFSRASLLICFATCSAVAAEPLIKYGPGTIDLRAKVAAWRAKKALPLKAASAAAPAVTPRVETKEAPAPMQPLVPSTSPIAKFMSGVKVPPVEQLIPFRFMPGEWRLHGGYVLRSLGSFSAHTHSLALASGLPSYLTPSGTGPQIGAAAGIGDRYYDDGFVRTDPITSTTGTTVFFGYNNNSQVQGDTISFHGSGTRQELSERLKVNPNDDANYLTNGINLGAAWEAKLPNGLHAGVDISLSLVGGSNTLDRHTFISHQRLDTYAFQVTDSYSTGGVLLPGAPFVGAPSNLAPEINSLPTRQLKEQKIGSETVKLSDRVRDNLDVTLGTLSLGPTLRYDYKGWELRGSAGFELNVISWAAESEQELFVSIDGGAARQIAQWRARRTGTDVLPGFYLQAGANRALSEHWSAGLSLRYDWSREFRTEVGNAQLGLQLSGLAAMWEMTYRF